MLARVIRGAVSDPQQPGDRGNVHDAPFSSRQHVTTERLRKEERSQEIDVHHPSPVVGSDRFGRCDETDARVVDEHIDATKVREDMVG